MIYITILHNIDEYFFILFQMLRIYGTEELQNTNNRLTRDRGPVMFIN